MGAVSRRAVRGIGGRSRLFVVVLVVGLGYATVSGHWGTVVNLLLRVA